MPGYAMARTPHCYVRRDFVDTYDGVVPYFGVETTETRVGTERDYSCCDCGYYVNGMFAPYDLTFSTARPILCTDLGFDPFK